MRGTARSHPLGGSLPPAHHTASGLAPLARGGVSPCTLTGKQLWPQCGCGLWSGRDVAAAAALCATITITITSSVQNGETAQWGLQCSRRCAWIRQFPRASYTVSRESGLRVFPPCKHQPYFQPWWSRAVAEVPSSLLKMARSVASLGRAVGLLRYAIYLVTVCPPPRDPAAVASGQCWGDWSWLAAQKCWTIVGTPERDRAGLRWGAMESLWSRNRLVPECRDGSQRNGA